VTTLRDVVTEALRAIKALAPGDGMTVDEIEVGLDAVQTIILEIHEARGPLRDVDATADYTAGENERVRIADGDTITVSLPNAVSTSAGRRRDYGFAPSNCSPPSGSTATPDGITYRAPRDGTRIEIVGTTQAIYFFRADLNQWVQADQRGIDDLMPLSGRYKGHLGALVALRLVDSWPGLFEPTASLAARVGRANSAIFVRPGVARDPVATDYF
jgi:hypothetical protein